MSRALTESWFALLYFGFLFKGFDKYAEEGCIGFGQEEKLNKLSENILFRDPWMGC